jgi:hypothetical protein
MPIKFALAAFAIAAVAAYVWVLSNAGPHAPQRDVATLKAPVADTAPQAEAAPAYAMFPEPLPAQRLAAASAPSAEQTQIAAALPDASAIGDNEPLEAADNGEASHHADSMTAADSVELTLLLQNGSEQQRFGALREAGEAGTTLPMAVLMQSLRYDRSDRIRAGTLDYLAESGGTRRSDLLDAIAIAERDPDAAIQARAHELRSGLQQLAIAEASAENLQQSAAP